MKIGVNTVLFGGYSLQTAMEYIKYTGYDGLELASIEGMAVHVHDNAADEEIHKIKEMARSVDLEMYSIEAATNILEEKNRERTKRVFACAAKLGIPIVTTGSSGTSDDEAQTEASIKAIAELAEAAGNEGIKFALKLHYGHSIYNTHTALRLMQEVKHPALGLNYDPTHVGRVGDDPVEALEALKEHVIHIHIRDTLIEQLQIAPPVLQIAGRGTTPLAAIVRKIKEIGYDGALDLEIIGAKNDPLPNVVAIAAESRGYFRRLFEEASV